MTKKEDGGGGGGGERRKGSIGHILRGIFRKNDEKDGKREEKVKRQKSESAVPVVEVDFGIETTEVLSHYRRARPPQNRRRPKTRQCQVCNGQG